MAKHKYSGEILNKEFNLVYGVEYYDAKHIIRGSEWNFDDLAITKEGWGFYGYSEYEVLDKLFLNTGARYQKAEYKFDQRNPSVVCEIRKPAESVFMGCLKYEYAPRSNIHFSVEESFRFLATAEWYSTWTGLNTNLRQQTAIQYELGLKHNMDDKFLFRVTPYPIDLENEIYFNPEPSPGQNENYDKTMRKGMELGMEGNLLRLCNISF